MRPHKTPASAIGAAVRRLRLARGMTQSQLAEAVDIADETLSRIETGRLPKVSMALAERLATVLRVEVADLFRPTSTTVPSELRAGESALLALVEPLSDAELNDLVRALRTLVRIARSVGAPHEPREETSSVSQEPERGKRTSRKRTD
jgi:transcriptional regulator with XRE-family HTH domain